MFDLPPPMVLDPMVLEWKPPTTNSTSLGVELAKPVWFDSNDKQRSPVADALSWCQPHTGLLFKHAQMFADLSDNWDGYGGIRPSDQTIGNVLDFLNQVGVHVLHLHQENLTPNPHGTISIEWEVDECNFLHVEVGESRWAYFYQVGTDHGDSLGNVPFLDKGALAALHTTLEALYGPVGTDVIEFSE